MEHTKTPEVRFEEYTDTVLLEEIEDGGNQGGWIESDTAVDIKR